MRSMLSALVFAGIVGTGGMWVFPSLAPEVEAAASLPASAAAQRRGAASGVEYLALLHSSFERAGLPSMADSALPRPRPAAEAQRPGLRLVGDGPDVIGALIRASMEPSPFEAAR